MSEKPISMCGEMVRAIMDGRKAETRRVIKLPVFDPLPDGYEVCLQLWKDGRYEIGCADGLGGGWMLGVLTPPFQPGDRLWVREKLVRRIDHTGTYYAVYACGEDAVQGPTGLNLPWCWQHSVLPSCFMPKAAARIWLAVESVGAERLQDITDAGIKAEGIRSDWTSDGGLPSLPEPLLRADFELLWDRLHARDGHTWDSNPWVWVIRFERETP